MMRPTFKKLPLKTDVFVYANYNSPFTIDELVEGLKEEHGKERQFKLKTLETYVIAYCGVDIIEPCMENPDELKFAVTEYGSKLIEYLPRAAAKE